MGLFVPPEDIGPGSLVGFTSGRPGVLETAGVVENSVEDSVKDRVVTGYAVSVSGPVTDGIGSPVGKTVVVPLSHVVFANGISTVLLEEGSGELSHAQNTPQPGLGHPGP